MTMSVLISVRFDIIASSAAAATVVYLSTVIQASPFICFMHNALKFSR